MTILRNLSAMPGKFFYKKKIPGLWNCGNSFTGGLPVIIAI